jgi:hypothetical protein
MKTLKVLFVSETAVTDAAIEEVKKTHPLLEVDR